MAAPLLKTAAIFILLGLNGGSLRGQTRGADETIRSAIAKQKVRPMWFRLRSVGLQDMPFVYQYKATKVKYNGDGSVKDEAWWKQQVVPVNGAVFLVDVDSSFGGDPKIRSAIEEQHKKENDERQRRMEHMSSEDKRKALEAKKKRQEERRQFWEEFLRAFRFNAAIHQDFHGRSTTVSEFSSDPAYRPHGVIDTAYFQKLYGRIWVDDLDLEIARLEIEFTKDVSGGLGVVGKVYKGTRYSMEFSKQLDDLWLPVRAETKLDQRILLFKEHETFTVEFGNYQKFATDVKIGDPLR